jgi:hypothetical protein
MSEVPWIITQNSESNVSVFADIYISFSRPVRHWHIMLLFHERTEHAVL